MTPETPPFMLPAEPRRKKLSRPEQQIQRAVVRHLNQRGVPGLFWFHPPNGGKRFGKEGAILKSLGVRAGVPDLILFHEFRSYALELKAEGGELTPAQEACLIALRAAGVSATHAHGLDQAVDKLEAWGLLRGRASLGRAAK